MATVLAVGIGVAAAAFFVRLDHVYCECSSFADFHYRVVQV